MQNKKTIFKRIIIVLLLYFAVFTAIIFLSSTGYSCPFRKYFGFNCIGCGMTRAFYALINLHFSEAFYLNALIYPLAVAVFAFSVYYIFFYRKSKK